MNLSATVVERVLTAVTWLAMHVVIVSERWRRRLPRRIRRWAGSVRRIGRQWVHARGAAPAPPRKYRRRRGWNRTPDHVEEQVVRLHVEHPHLHRRVYLGTPPVHFGAARGSGVFAAAPSLAARRRSPTVGTMVA